jgi:hypothetical protein
MSGAPRSNLGFVARDMNGSIPVSSTNSSGPSIGVSSLVTDGNSSLSGGAQFQHSTHMDADSFMRTPTSPVSFSSNNISSSSVNDESIMQQSSSQEQMQNRRSSSVTSQPGSEAGGAFHAPRVDISQDDILQQHLIQQLLQCQSSLLEGQSYPQLQDLIWQLDLQAFMSDAPPLDPLSPIPPLSFAFVSFLATFSIFQLIVSCLPSHAHCFPRL